MFDLFFFDCCRGFAYSETFAGSHFSRLEVKYFSFPPYIMLLSSKCKVLTYAMGSSHRLTKLIKGILILFAVRTKSCPRRDGASKKSHRSDGVGGVIDQQDRTLSTLLMANKVDTWNSIMMTGAKNCKSTLDIYEQRTIVIS